MSNKYAPSFYRIDCNEEITYKKSITEKINSFLVNTGTNLEARKPHATTNFQSYLPDITLTFWDNCLTKEEFKNAFFH